MEQYLNELFIDGLKVDQFVTNENGEELDEEEIETVEWTKWIERPVLPPINKSASSSME